MPKMLILLFLLLIASAAFAEEVNRDSSKECAVCHYEWMPEFVFNLRGTEIVDYQSEKVVATEKMCFSCHNGTVGDSRIKIWSGDMHKLADKIPEYMRVPENLPLDNGKINCRTCHTAHATGDPKAEGVEKSVFLRVENDDSQLCESCHTTFSKGARKSHPLKKPEKNYAVIEKRLNDLGAKLGSQGRIVCQSCHTSHSPRDKKLLIYQETDSKLCSICHADKVNPENAIYVKGMLNHPINVTHDNPLKVAQVKREGGVYGKVNEVICLTCHSPHKGETETLLIEKNGGSEICITCHEEKKKIIDSKHNMRKVAGFRTKDGKSAQEKGTCGSCHAPHGWSLNLPSTGKDMLSKGCLSCHQEGGFAGKKVFSATLFNHPVGRAVKTDMEVGNLPLFADTIEDFEEIRSESEPGNIITCATCHDSHSGNKNFLRADAESGRLCTTCHNEKAMIEKTPHGRKNLDGSCLSCHKIHNSENKRLLNAGENDGCLDCHRKGGSAEKLVVDLKHSHPVNMRAKTKVKEEFKTTPEGLFTCVSCHDPHKPSKTDKMQKDFLRGGYSEIDSFCGACHEKQKEIIDTDHDNRKTETDSVCGQCHSVHNAKTAIRIMAVEYDYKETDDNCKACHNRKGTASKKVVMDGHKIGKTDPVEKYRKYLSENEKGFFLYCSSCHTVHNNGPKKGEDGTIKNSFLNRKLSENGNFCTGCHEDKKSIVASMHNVNKFDRSTEKTTALQDEGDICGACHVVHNSGYYLFDKSLGNDFEKICLSCHTKEGLAAKTSVSSSHKMNVKLKKNRDVFLQNGNIVCATCHEPHAGTKGMLRDMGEKNICIACHEDQKMVTLSDHNLARVDYLEKAARGNAEENVCFACHEPHNFHRDNKLMWTFDPKRKGVFAFEICTDCHTKGGAGYKKIPEAFNHDKIFKIFPLNVKEEVKEYLFDDDGEKSLNGSITCQSCHNPHVGKNGMTAPEAGAEGGGSFLKQNVREEFCAKCHGDEQSKDLFDKYHDKKFRQAKNENEDEANVLRNMMIIQMNLQKIQERK